MVEDVWGYKAETTIETGATPSDRAEIRKRDDDQPLRLIWCGILEARKSLHLVLQAVAQLPPEMKVELHVIGNGAERGNWQALGEKLELGERVTWHGRVTHAEAQDLMSSGHALVHSSVKEGTPHVVLEAMSLGMPVICHDACGMGVAVDETSGIKIPTRNPETSILGFREALKRLWTEAGLLTKLSEGALQRALNLTWESKVRLVDKAYRQISTQEP